MDIYVRLGGQEVLKVVGVAGYLEISANGLELNVWVASEPAAVC